MDYFVEWIVTRDKEVWTDGFNHEEDAIDYMEKCKNEDGATYEVVGMTEAEAEEYWDSY